MGIIKRINKWLNPCPKGGLHNWKNTGKYTAVCEEKICTKCKRKRQYYMPPH